MDAAGIITTIAGNGFISSNAPTCDFLEDDLLAVNVRLCDPLRGLATDASGNIYFEDGL